MDIRLNEVKAILKKYGQEHLLNHYDDLDENKKEELINQINQIDFDLVNDLYNSTKQTKTNSHDKIEAIDYFDKYKLNIALHLTS